MPRRTLKDDPVKPGWATSEFWLSAIALIVAGVLAGVGRGVDAERWLEFAQWIVGGYSVSRGLAKAASYAAAERGSGDR